MWDAECEAGRIGRCHQPHSIDNSAAENQDFEESHEPVSLRVMYMRVQNASKRHFLDDKTNRERIKNCAHNILAG